MGRIHFFFGDRQKALDSFNRSAQLYSEAGQRYGEALALASVGTAYFSLGDLARALENHERTFPTLAAVGDLGNQCISLNHLGDIHLAMGDSRKALDSYNRALAFARELKNSQLESISLRNLANFHLSQGDGSKALDYYLPALKLVQMGGFRINEAILHRSIGNVSFMMGDTDKALGSLNQALEQFRSVKFRAEEANTLHSLARVNFSKGNLIEARKQIEMALDIKESLHAPVLDRDLRISSIASIQNSYSLYINLLMQFHQKQSAENHDLAALKVSEHARARGLLELLVESGAEIREGASPELLALERSLQRQINAKAALRTKLRDMTQGASVDKEISQLTSRYHEVEAHIRATSPRYAALTQPQPLSVGEIQQLLDEASALLEFSLGEDGSWLWVVTSKGISSHPLPQRAAVEAAARKVYDLLIARQPRAGLTDPEQTARIKEADARFQIEAAALSRMLFGDIAGRLRQELKGKRLLIVPSGALEYLPFAALPNPSNENGYQPLIADHEIVNLPSASVLSLIRRETADRAAAPGTVAILADPVFDAGDPRLLQSTKRRVENHEIAVNTRSGAEVTSATNGPATAGPPSVRGVDGGRLSRLPFSGEEADAIAELVPARLRIKATDFEATRAKALSSELSNYRIVHFATHGLLNSQHPDLSGLVLSLVDENGKPQDGFLRMHEIYNLRLPAEVVVLSACQTGLGKEIRGEGLVGLTRGFMYAGAQRVVASLWQVDDRATAQLMKYFYQAMLREGLRPAAALRRAQIELMKEKRWSSPYFWAAFVMQGEWK
jgi:CHAT domain-containing protein/tetratricopeptide (TPR) repeat protein